MLSKHFLNLSSKILKFIYNSGLLHNMNIANVSLCALCVCVCVYLCVCVCVFVCVCVCVCELMILHYLLFNNFNLQFQIERAHLASKTKFLLNCTGFHCFTSDFKIFRIYSCTLLSKLLWFIFNNYCCGLLDNSYYKLIMFSFESRSRLK
jgi:hypothetical protein